MAVEVDNAKLVEAAMAWEIVRKEICGGSCAFVGAVSKLDSLLSEPPPPPSPWRAEAEKVVQSDSRGIWLKLNDVRGWELVAKGEALGELFTSDLTAAFEKVAAMARLEAFEEVSKGWGTDHGLNTPWYAWIGKKVDTARARLAAMESGGSHAK